MFGKYKMQQLIRLMARVKRKSIILCRLFDSSIHTKKKAILLPCFIYSSSMWDLVTLLCRVWFLFLFICFCFQMKAQRTLWMSLRKRKMANVNIDSNNFFTCQYSVNRDIKFKFTHYFKPNMWQLHFFPCHTRKMFTLKNLSRLFETN